MSPNDEQTPTSLNKLSIGFNQSKEYNLNCRQFRQKEFGQKKINIKFAYRFMKTASNNKSCDVIRQFDDVTLMIRQIAILQSNACRIRAAYDL